MWTFGGQNGILQKMLVKPLFCNNLPSFYPQDKIIITVVDKIQYVFYTFTEFSTEK